LRAPPYLGDVALGKQSEPGFLPGSEVEWTGLFLFAVGVFGAYYHAVMRHWALWGIIPLDWFYLTMLVMGSLLLLAASPLAPWNRREVAEGEQHTSRQGGLAGRILRSAVALALLFTIIFIAISHHARL
jgi:heme/copper-type cytochrome/quinol oxidase subunit 3